MPNIWDRAARRGMTERYFGAWPRLLRAAQAFERLRHAEHAEVVKATADDLHADRKALLL